MKMARASERDLEAALAVSRILEDLEEGYMPGPDDAEDIEFFDRDDPEQCRRALDAILRAAQQGGIFRVTFGMTVVLDPRNKLLDPDADTLELSPEHVRNAEDAARYRLLRNGGEAAARIIDDMAEGTLMHEEIDAACDAALHLRGDSNG